MEDKSASSLPTKPIKVKTQIMVDNAIKSLNERSGSSLVAIKKFLVSTYLANVEKASTSSAIKKYIKESVQSGKLIQVKGIGLTGSFKLSKDAMKEPKVKQKKPKEGASNVKKLKEGKEAKAIKNATSKNSAIKGKVQPKKMATGTGEKKVPVPKLTAALEKKKATAAVNEVPKKKLAKKQESEAVKAAPKKKTLTAKKDKLPVKKMDKENIHPTKKKPITKKKELEEPPARKPVSADVEDEEEEEDSEDSITDSTAIKVKQALSFNELAYDEEPEESVDTEQEEEQEEDEDDAENKDDAEDEDDRMRPEEIAQDQLSESDKSVSSEESPEKPPTKGKAKGRVVSKPVKKRKSIATLVNATKPKIAKK